LLGVTEIGQGHGWHDPDVLALLGLALLALVAFVWYERRAPEPLLPMHLFANSNAVLCWCTMFFTSFQSISLIVLMPLRFQTVTGGGADAAALHLLPLAIGMPMGAYFGGRRTSLTGRYKPLILTGALMMPFVVLGLAFTPPQSVLITSVLMVLTGFACGLQFPTSLVGTQNSVAQADMGVATSTTNLFRSLGGAVGIALMSALLLAMLQGSGIGQVNGGPAGEVSSGNLLMDSLNAVSGPALELLRGQLSLTFRHLLIISAGISLLGLAAAIAMPNNLLRGRAHGDQSTA
jgi:hypothetical protein